MVNVLVNIVLKVIINILDIDIAKKNGKEAFKPTIVHEIGHYIAKCLYPQYIRPHGKEWKAIMVSLGVNDPKATHTLKCTSARKVKKVPYHCSCLTHMITRKTLSQLK